jgi:hypothetical protein
LVFKYFVKVKKKVIMEEEIIIPKALTPPEKVTKLFKEFLTSFKIYEIENGGNLLLHYDKKSSTYYLICHLNSSELTNNTDLDATLDSENEEDVIYKLNREITEDQSAFEIMQKDAKDSRTFEDIVLEYDKSYLAKKPLKVYGGQHRVRAITVSLDSTNDVPQGVRVYFDLTREQKVEIATINNTSIVVPNDLLDRMREQLLGSELRDWCQKVGLLNTGQDFSDKKSPETPTVRIARTLLLNYYLAKDKKVEDIHQPVLAKSGGLDDSYFKLRATINWDDEELITMGKEFAKLHKKQRETVINREEDNFNEFARKTYSLAVVSSWAYAAGLFSGKELQTLYDLPKTVTPPEDPLNAKALSQARLKGTDPDTYRGLGARSSPSELGRMLEVFIVLCTKAQIKRITQKLANAAIQSYEAKKSRIAADQAIEKI